MASVEETSSQFGITCLERNGVLKDVKQTWIKKATF